LSCPSISVTPFNDDDGQLYHLKNISNTYFLSSSGLTKKTANSRMYKIMENLIDENNYQEYHVLLTGERNRSIFNPRFEMIARVKFFSSVKEYELFKKYYKPFGQ